MKHPALRVAAWQWIAPEYRARIADAILNLAVPTLPFKPVRVELVGSMIRGCARLDSDFDLNLAAHDWNEQVAWRRLWSDHRYRLPFVTALAPIMEELGIKIEAAPNNPDQYTYDICFDFLTGTLADVANAFPDRSARWWDGYQLKWRPKPLMQEEPGTGIDEWPTIEVEHWRATYGDRFLENTRSPG
jgi:hypothetical protein